MIILPMVFSQKKLVQSHLAFISEANQLFILWRSCSHGRSQNIIEAALVFGSQQTFYYFVSLENKVRTNQLFGNKAENEIKSFLSLFFTPQGKISSTWSKLNQGIQNKQFLLTHCPQSFKANTEEVKKILMTNISRLA